RQHPVRANAATASTPRFEAVCAARDADALPTLLADEYRVVDHTTGVTYDRQGELTSYRALMRARDPTLRTEPLATLGDSLSLSRVSMSASGFVGGTFDVGAYEREQIALNEVDANGRRRRMELFAADRLGDAVVRLYERYAELLPDGPARTRAAATARSFSGIAAFELDRWAAAVAPAIEVVDHRTLGTWSARGAEAFLEHLRAVLGLADDTATRDDDVLALQPDALLVRRTQFGTARAGGGAYERLFLLLHVFGADGLVARLEFFDSDCEDEALARFDELTVAPTGARLTGAPLRAAEKRERRVRPNAATANAARLDAAIAVRDADALPTLTADVCEVVDHTTGATYGRQGSLTTWRTLLSARDPTWRQEPLATLGDSLALFRLWMSASGFAGASFDVGAYE